jgi:AraC family transcriptional regulator
MQPDKSGKLILREKNIADGLHLVLKNYPAGLRMERHAHEEWRYCLALRGSYTDSWQRNYRTRTPGQLSLHPPSEMHTSVFHTPAACFHIGFTRDWRKRLLDEAGIAQEPLEFLSGRAPSLASQLYQEFRRSDGCSPLVLEGLACELAGWSARSQRGEPAGPSWAYEARDLLHDRFHESLNLKEIAATFGVHSVHLARQFKRTFGWTVGDYVRRLRVEFVCQQLETGKPLAELALRAGFSDQSHLTRIFKRFTGQTPGEYRAKC